LGPQAIHISQIRCLSHRSVFDLAIQYVQHTNLSLTLLTQHAHFSMTRPFTPPTSFDLAIKSSHLSWSQCCRSVDRKYFFWIRIRRSVILNYGSGSGRPIIVVPSGSYLTSFSIFCSLKKYAVKQVLVVP
jgi:hypothetical protein